MTDEQAKEWIDSKNVLTKRELAIFVYGKDGNNTKERIKRLWNYVLDTKDWKALREYADKKVNTGRPCGETKKIVLKLFKTDKRLQEYGSRRGTRILQDVHGIKLHRHYYTTYKREALC